MFTSILNLFEMSPRLEPLFVPAPALQKFRLDGTPALQALSNSHPAKEIYITHPFALMVIQGTEPALPRPSAI
jgi:hypothetical protein